MEPSDAALVSGALRGDQDALGTIYRRYGDRIFSFCLSRLRDRALAEDAAQDTFVRAAGRLAQLRDPEKLRPWLFAIARNAIVDQVRRRERETGDEELAMIAADDAAPDTDLTRADAAAALWAASTALQERDQELLELHVRHGLDGEELAAALGVDRKHCTVLLTRLRHRIEKALGSLLVARHGRTSCAELAGVLAGWDGTYTIDVRSRVTRHVAGCHVCSEHQARLMVPANYLGVLPLVAAPAALGARITGAMTGAVGAAGSGGSAPAEPTDAWRWREDGFPESRGTPNTPGGIGLTTDAPPPAAAPAPRPLPPVSPVHHAPPPPVAVPIEPRAQRRGTRPVVAALVMLVALVIGGALAVTALTGDDGDDTATEAAVPTEIPLVAPSTGPLPDPTATPAPTVTPVPTAAPEPTATTAPLVVDPVAPTPTSPPPPSPTPIEPVVVQQVLVDPPAVVADNGTGCAPVASTVFVVATGSVERGRITWTLGSESGEAPLTRSATDPTAWGGEVGPFPGTGQALVAVELTATDGTLTTAPAEVAVLRCG